MGVERRVKLRRRWLRVGAASALGLAILVVGATLVEPIRIERRLRNICRSLETKDPRILIVELRDRGFSAMTPRQAACRRKAFERAAARIIAGHPGVKKAADQLVDPSDPDREYLTADQTLVVELAVPVELRTKGASLLVDVNGATQSSIPLDNDESEQLLQPVRVEPEGRRTEVDFILAVTFHDGTEARVPLVRGLRLGRTSLKPGLFVKAGEKLIALDETSEPSLRVDVNAPLELVVRCEHGISHAVAQCPEVSTISRPFDGCPKEGMVNLDELTRHPQSMSVEVRARSIPGVSRSARFELRVRDPAVPAVAGVRVAGQTLDEGGIVSTRESAIDVEFTIPSFESPTGYAAELAGKPLTLSGGATLRARADQLDEGLHAFVITAPDGVAMRAQVAVDHTPPKVVARVDPSGLDRPIEPGANATLLVVPACLAISVSDAGAVAAGDVSIRVEGREPHVIDDPAARGDPHETTRIFRFQEPGSTVIRVTAQDRAGNRADEVVYRLKTVDAAEATVVTIGERPFPGTATTVVRAENLRAEVRTLLRLDDVRILLSAAGSQASPVVDTPLVAKSADRLAADIQVPALGDRGCGLFDVIVAAGARNILARGRILIDAQPPRCGFGPSEHDIHCVGGSHEVRLTGQGPLAVSVVDNVEVDQASVSVDGATVAHVLANDGRNVSVILGLTPGTAGAVTVRIRDTAGNPAAFEFHVVGSAPVGVPAATSQPTPPLRNVPAGGSSPPRSPTRQVTGPQLLEVPRLGVHRLVRPKHGVSKFDGFYLGEREVGVRALREFVLDLRQGADTVAKGGFTPAVTALAERALQANLDAGRSGDMAAGWMSSDLALAYASWANVVAPTEGYWQIPSVEQWKLAAGRALHQDSVYPTTAHAEGGLDLSEGEPGGALFGRQPEAIAKVRINFQPGSFGIFAMAGGVHEWCAEPSGRLRLIGGSVSSDKAACRIDADPPAYESVRPEVVGLRLALVPVR